MGYLHRHERRTSILNAAMRVALDEGFSAMTVRNIAAQAGVATGQVHHHFHSAGELKAEAFIALIRQMMAVDIAAADASFHARLQAVLGSDEHHLAPYIRLWREAQVLAESDAVIREAYRTSMELWHEQTVELIHQGVTEGAFFLADSADATAWRLIAMVCGLDGLMVLGLADMGDEAWNAHLRHTIENEVGKPQTSV